MSTNTALLRWQCAESRAIACLCSPAASACADSKRALADVEDTHAHLGAARREGLRHLGEPATKEELAFSEGLLTIEGTLANFDVYKLENLPLFLEIEPEESKWFKNDRCSSHSPVAAGLSGGSSSGAAVVRPLLRR